MIRNRIRVKDIEKRKKNYEKRKENYTEEYNNDGENRREDNRRYHQQGYRNNQRGNKYRGGNNYVQKGRGGGNRSKYQDFDLFESTKQFEKEKEMAKIEEQVKGMKVEGNISSNEDPEKAYDPEVSLFDTLSCETFERLKNKPINRREKNRLQEEQQRIDQETFGLQPSYDNRRPNYNNNYQKKRLYNNTRPNRNQYQPRPGYNKPNQGRKFRPVNKEQTDSN